MSTEALKSDSPSGKTRSLHRDFLSDESGATMVIGVFMAAMLVGFLYYLHGTANVILHRDRMQDAADSGAFAAAVIHARAMNILSILNVIMAVFAVIGAAMRIAQDIVLGAAIAASAVCAGCGPWCVSCCNACVPAVRHWMDWPDARSNASDVEGWMENLTRLTHGVAVVVRTGAPVMAELRVLTWGEQYAPTVGMSFMISDTITSLSLPAEEDDSNWPCDNKVRYWAGLLGAVLSYTQTDFSIYLAAASVTVPFLRATPRARYWCDDMDNFQKIQDDAWLGEREFQVLSVMEGEQRFRWTGEGVAVAGWGNDGSNSSEEFEALDNFSIAQAEFYFESEDEQEHEEWLWHSNWRARMRRVDLDDVPVVGMIPGIDIVSRLFAH